MLRGISHGAIDEPNAAFVEAIGELEGVKWCDLVGAFQLRLLSLFESGRIEQVGGQPHVHGLRRVDARLAQHGSQVCDQS